MKAKLFTKNCSPFPKDFLQKSMQPLKKSYIILCAFEVLNVDNLNNVVNLFGTSIWVLVTFYETEQVDEFQGKEPEVDAIIDKEEPMKNLSDFLLDSKDAFQCHNKKTNLAAADLKEKLTKEKKTVDKIKKNC